MINDTPFTKEEVDRFIARVRARSEQRRYQQKIERACIAAAGVICAVIVAIAFVS